MTKDLRELLGLVGWNGTEQPLSKLTIARRVLQADGRMIALRNIATVAVGDERKNASRPYWVLAAATGLTGITLFGFSLYPAGAIALLIALSLFAYSLTRHDDSPYLLIASNDGTRTLFASPNREMLDKVLHLLSDKIDADDETATFAIDFQQVTIEALDVGEDELLGLAGVPQLPSAQVVAAQSSGARPATSTGADFARHLPGTVAGTVGRAAGDTDFSAVLPQIEHLHRFYAQNPTTKDIAERLAELEALMHAGANTPQARARARELAADLSRILRAYPSMVQLFGHVAGLCSA